MRFAGVLAVLMLAGCVLSGAKDDSGAAANRAPKPNPILQGAIVTTPLKAPAGPVDPAAPESPPAEPALSDPDPDPPATAEDDPGAAAEIPAPPPEPASPEEAKCLRSGGSWATAGKSGAKACVTLTKDAGKACTKQSQCDGFCLARSRTCAPFTPMFGCNDILQDDGREVTLCLD